MRSYVDHQGLNATKLHDLTKSLSIVEQEDIFRVTDEVRNRDDNNTILHSAALLDDELISEKILQRLSPNSRLIALKWQNLLGQTPISIAASKGHLSLMKIMLGSVEKGHWHEILQMWDNSGETAIHSAVRSGCSDTLEHILDYETSQETDRFFSLSLTGRFSQTPLHIAAEEGCERMVMLMKNAIGQECWLKVIFMRDANGCTPIDLAVLRAHDEILKRLLHNLDSDKLFDVLKTAVSVCQTVIFESFSLGFAVSVKYILNSLDPEQRLRVLCCDNFSDKSVLHELLITQPLPARLDAAIDCILDCLPQDQLFEFLRKTDNNGKTVIHYAAGAGADKWKAILTLLEPLPAQRQHEILLVESIDHQKASDCAKQHGHLERAYQLGKMIKGI